MKEIRERIEEVAGEEKSTLRLAPDLDLRVRSEGEDWILSYDLRTGSLSERKADEPKMDFNLRSFLMRLHVSRGYPSEIGLRTFWGAIVDVTAFLMIFWAISGVVMWWQLKPTRGVGILTVVVGVVLAGLLAYGMFVALYY